MILFLMRKERASLNRLCIFIQACFFSLWMDLMTQQLGLMLWLTVLLLDVSSISTSGSSSSCCSEIEERSQMLWACRQRCRRPRVRSKTYEALISKDCYINYQSFKQLIAPHNPVNSREANTCLALPINGPYEGKMEYGYLIKLHIDLAICIGHKPSHDHSSQFSEMGEDSEEEESCSASLWRGSLLKRFRQMLMAQQWRFLSLTLDSLIQLRAYVSKKLRKISRRVQLLMIFFIRLLLYFLRYSSVLYVRMASRISFLSNMFTFSDFKNATNALQKFFEMFLVFLRWSSSPSLLSLLLLIFLKMYTFLPSVLSLVSFFSLSLVETASLVSLGSCSGWRIIQFSGMRREQVSQMVQTLSLQTISVIFLIVLPFISQRWFFILSLEEVSSSNKERWKLFWYSQSMLLK